MKIKTKDLTDGPLDWAVAVAEGRWQKWIRSPNPKRLGTSILDIGLDENGNLSAWSDNQDRYEPYSPSTNPMQAYPIIEREKISIIHRPIPEDEYWVAEIDHPLREEDGPTPLIAAMRCRVSLKLGDEVDVPKELL